MTSKASNQFSQPSSEARANATRPEPAEAGSGDAAQVRKDGNAFLAGGLGIGAFGVASGVLLGAVCPVCVVATPALIGAGVYKRIRAWRIDKR